VKIDFSKVIVRPILSTNEEARLVELMRAHHYLSYNGVIGERIHYVAEYEGTWVALLSWACAALKTGDRDKWIGWCREQKMARLKFVSNNWRFLILPEFQIKNLASHVLSKNLRRLSNDWEQKYKHPILMAETFVDATRNRGTCYRAENWILVGETQGFQKDQDSYHFHGNKKLIFMKPLRPRAREILGNEWTHPLFLQLIPRKVTMANTDKILIFGETGLYEFCKGLQDSRSKYGLRHQGSGLMVLCTLAVLSGAKSYNAIGAWIKTIPIKTLHKLRIWVCPSVSTVRRYLMGLDSLDTDQKLTQWLLSNDSLNGIALAIDGKTLRGSRNGETPAVQLLSIVTHEDAQIIAQRKISDKTNEIPVARQLIEDLPIQGAIITADALHTQTETATTIVRDNKAEYVFTVKDNQPKLKQEIQSSLQNSDFSPSANSSHH